jgi:hypothetical protein
MSNVGNVTGEVSASTLLFVFAQLDAMEGRYEQVDPAAFPSIIERKPRSDKGTSRTRKNEKPKVNEVALAAPMSFPARAAGKRDLYEMSAAAAANTAKLQRDGD